MGAAIFFSCKYIRGMFWSSAGKREIVTKQKKHINFLLTLSKEGSLWCYTGCDTLGLWFFLSHSKDALFSNPFSTCMTSTGYWGCTCIRTLITARANFGVEDKCNCLNKGIHLCPRGGNHEIINVIPDLSRVAKRSQMIHILISVFLCDLETAQISMDVCIFNILI